MASLVSRYPVLEQVKKEIADGYQMLESCYKSGGKLLIAGNGGSAADAGHMAGELMKSFRRPRPVSQDFSDRLEKAGGKRGSQLAKILECPLAAIPLSTQGAFVTAYINDTCAEGIFAQQLLGYGRKGDVFLGISTSGNSENILNAAVTAKALDIKVIALTGAGGGKLAEMADVAVKIPAGETYLVQEMHLPVYHCWCMMLEERFFGPS